MSIINSSYSEATESSTEILKMMVTSKSDVLKMRQLLQDLLALFQSDTSESRKFCTTPGPLTAFMKLMFEPGIDNINMSIFHTIFIYLCEEDKEGDRKGLRNMIKCTFAVQQWDEYVSAIEGFLDRKDSETFRKVCRLYYLFTFVNEVRQDILPAEFDEFVSRFTTQLLRGIDIFQDAETLDYTLECLLAVIVHFDVGRDTVLQRNAHSKLFQVLCNHQDDASVVERCLKIFNPLTNSLLQNHPDIYIGSKGIYSMVFQCMNSHVESEGLIEAGCRILNRAIIVRPKDKNAMLDGDAWSTIAYVQAKHIHNAEIEASLHQLLYELRRTTDSSTNEISSSRNPNYSRRNRSRSGSSVKHTEPKRHSRRSDKIEMPKAAMDLNTPRHTDKHGSRLG